MLDCSIVWQDRSRFWADQDREHCYVMVNEVAGEFGAQCSMLPSEAEEMNIVMRLADNPWRWFRFEEKEKAN